MSLPLDRKTALVTGGSRGIGRAIGERLAADGATVVINYARNEQLAHEVVKAISAKGGKAMGIQADVSKPAEVRRLFGEAEKAMDPPTLLSLTRGSIFQNRLSKTPRQITTMFSISIRGASFSRCRKPPVACVQAGGGVV